MPKTHSYRNRIYREHKYKKKSEPKLKYCTKCELVYDRIGPYPEHFKVAGLIEETCTECKNKLNNGECNG